MRRTSNQPQFTNREADTIMLALSRHASLLAQTVTLRGEVIDEPLLDQARTAGEALGWFASYCIEADCYDEDEATEETPPATT